MTRVQNCNLEYASFNSSGAITFTFELIPLVKAWNLLSFSYGLVSILQVRIGIK